MALVPTPTASRRTKLGSIVRLGFCCLLAACVVGPHLGAPNLEGFNPPSQYQFWWSTVEECAGRSGNFRAVQFFRSRDDSLVVAGKKFDGYWWSAGNRIALLKPDYCPTVRHEMLHAILQRGDHPSEFFAEQCAGIVSHLGGELHGIPANAQSARRIAPDSLLHVVITPVPGILSVGQHDGAFGVMVTATSVRSFPAWIQVESGALGVLYILGQPNVSGVIPGDSVYFGPGQQRRLMLDAIWSTPGVIRLQADYADARSALITVTVQP
ncbi:MAG: hypothetical protein H7Z40_21155 [Phycisphaerae bacterium]|nr:hypothetical protein [Gemmatimonadaceae bacterium]